MQAMLDGVPVREAMHLGLVTCPPDASLRAVARLLATYHVHAVLVGPHGRERLDEGAWTVVDDVDLLRAADESADLDQQPASSLPATPAATVLADERLSTAVHRMLERGSSHLLVLDPASQHPIGVVSAADVARILAGFPQRDAPVR